MEILLEGLKLIREALQAEPFDEYRGEEVSSGSDVHSEEQLIEHICETATSLYHPVGTCKMVDDEMTVVDDDLSVHGIDTLRIADTSIMLIIIIENTDASTTMIDKKAADYILGA